MKNQNRLITMVYTTLAMLIIVSATACGATRPDSTALPTETPVQIKVNLQPYIGFAPFVLAREEGYFARYGIQVEFVQVPSTEAVPLLMQGELDMISTVINPNLFNAIARGGSGRIVLSMSQWSADGCASVAILGNKDRAAQLQNISTWKRLALSTDSTGAQGMQGYMLNLVLAQGGLTLADVEVNKLAAPDAFEALKSGAVPLAISVEPWVTRIVQGNYGDILQSAPEVLPDAQYSVVLFSERLLQSPDLGQRVARAYLDAVRQYQDGSTERNVEIVATYTSLDAQLLKQICWATIPTDGAINLDSVMAYQEWAVAQGLLDQVVSPDMFWDGRFIQEPDASTP